jgi:hypothetical protein
MQDGDALLHVPYIVDGDPFEIVGVARNATKPDIQRAFRKRARELHPDVSDSPSSPAQFRELVSAFKLLCRLEPGSSETHALWPYLSVLDKYWSREQGHVTAEDLEQYLKDIGQFESYVAEMRAAEQAVAVADDVAADDVAADDMAADEAMDSEERIVDVLEFRVFMGSEQWLVRWASSDTELGNESAEEGETSWERYAVLDSDALRSQAELVRAERPGARGDTNKA